jgi:glycosidase
LAFLYRQNSSYFWYNPATMKQTSTDKLIIYQIFTRLFGNTKQTNKYYGSLEENGSGKFNDVNHNALKSIKDLGISHVWYTGIIEHATMTDYTAFGIKKDNPLVVKGIAGSPYAVKDYYDVNPDLAVDVTNRMKEFEELVLRTHNSGLKVIIDFIPNHVAREYCSDAKPKRVKDFGETDDTTKAFARDNNFYYLPNEKFRVPDEVNPPVRPDEVFDEIPAKATGNDVFSASPNINDWFETIKLNYGIDYLDNHSKHFDPIPDTWKKMKDILLFWAKKGIDGFRCDMAEMVPTDFWEWVIQEVKQKFPSVIFIAEIYNPQLYHEYIFKGGFDYLYDKVGLYDSLRRLIEGNGNTNDITRVWQNESGDFANHMLRFLENHDEHRIASKEFAGDPFRAIPAMALSAFLHTGPLMLYFGQEIGIKSTESTGFKSADGRTTIFDYWSLEEIIAWNNKGKWNTLRLQYANNHGQSKNYNDARLYAFLRYTQTQKLLFLFNFDQNESYETELRIPELALEMMGYTGELTLLKADKKLLKLESNEAFLININPNSYLVFDIC